MALSLKWAARIAWRSGSQQRHGEPQVPAGIQKANFR
jgi:hypothetical protein